MHMHQAMQELEKKQFVEAMKKEVRDQFENGNFAVMHNRNSQKELQHCQLCGK
jgi:hypothetical protein